MNLSRTQVWIHSLFYARITICLLLTLKSEIGSLLPMATTSDEGVKMLASNLRRSIDKVLDIPQNPMRKDPRPRRPWRRPNEQRQRRYSVSQ